MYLRLSFVTLIFAIVALGMPVKRDEALVEKDLKDLSDKLQALDASVVAFPVEGGTLVDVTAVHGATMKLDNTIRGATNDAIGSPSFTEAQSETIAELMADAIAPTVKKGIDDLITKKPAVYAIHAESFAEMDLETLRTDTNAFADAILAKTTVDKQGDVKAQFDAITDALAEGIEAYSA